MRVVVAKLNGSLYALPLLDSAASDPALPECIADLPTNDPQDGSVDGVFQGKAPSQAFEVEERDMIGLQCPRLSEAPTALAAAPPVCVPLGLHATSGRPAYLSAWMDVPVRTSFAHSIQLSCSAKLESSEYRYTFKRSRVSSVF